MNQTIGAETKTAPSRVPAMRELWVKKTNLISSLHQLGGRTNRSTRDDAAVFLDICRLYNGDIEAAAAWAVLTVISLSPDHMMSVNCSVTGFPPIPQSSYEPSLS